MVAALLIAKEKNLFKGECVHHGVLEGQIFACPMKSLSRQVAHIWVHIYDGTTFLCAYWDSVGRGNVTDREMRFRKKFAAAKLGYLRSNILLDRIDTHFNQAGRGCAMKLVGFDDESI